MLRNAQLNEHHGELAKSVLHAKHKFPGKGQKDTYVFDIEEAIIFLDCLPHRHTGDIKQHIRTQFLRVTAGDPSLHAEVERNAQSGGFLQQAAREVLDVPQAVVTTDEEPLPLGDGIDSNLPIVKRVKTLDFVTHVHAKLLDRRIASSQSIVSFMQALGGVEPSYRQELQLHAKRLHDQFNGSCDNAQVLIMSGTTEDLDVATAVTNSAVVDVRQLARDMGHKATDTDLQQLGRGFSKEYQRRFPRGPAPPKSVVHVEQGSATGSNTFLANEYTANHLEWMKPIVAAYFAKKAGDPPPGQKTLRGFLVGVPT
jgi:hypothetical protein